LGCALFAPVEPRKKEGMSAEDIARMEPEMESLERDLKNVSDNYTENMFTLTTAHTYIKNLLKNAKVVRYLNANHSEIRQCINLAVGTARCAVRTPQRGVPTIENDTTPKVERI
jgi:hypothetical protein